MRAQSYISTTLAALLLPPLFFLPILQITIGWPVDPTRGFTTLPLVNMTDYHIQRPYDLPVSDRYSFKNGVHKLWVYSTDNPLSKGSLTNPRTEIIINGSRYKSGVWQFEGHGYVPCGTSGACIMQVFGAQFPHNTTLMLRVYNGSLYNFNESLIVPNIYDRWFKLNVIHDVEAARLKVYIDGELKLEAKGRGGAFHYFKCGVYGQDHMSYYMESRWKGIKVLKKCDA